LQDVHSERRTLGGRVQALRKRLEASPRAVPHVRLLRTTLRSLHLLTFGLLFGGHAYGVDPIRLISALIATLLSGGALMALELYRTPLWLLQIRGLMTQVKILLVILVGPLWEYRVWLLALAIVTGSIASHMPGRWRYHSILHGRVVNPPEMG